MKIIKEVSSGLPLFFLVVVNDNLDFDDAALVNFQEIEGEALVFNAFALNRELALYLEQ